MLPEGPHGRRLTAGEQMRLEQLERQLRDEDPELAAVLAGAGADTPPRFVARPPRWALVVGAVAVTTVLLVMAALVGGVGGAAAVVATLLAAFAGWRLVQRRHGRRR